jgi:Hypothetical protein (DUF2513)
MKRDMELIRELMLAIDSREDTSECWAEDLEIVGDRDIAQIKYHLQLLVDAGFLEANIEHDNGPNSPSILIIRMLWDGHEFLDNARNESIWREAMNKIAEKGGSVAVGVLIQVLAGVAKQQMGLI